MFKSGEEILVCVVLPERDSLSRKYDSVYVKERLNAIRLYYSIEILYDGENIEYCDTCICDNSPAYIIDFDFGTGESPILCGKCLKPVPLYRLAKIEGEVDHDRLVRWQTAAHAMRLLWHYGLWDNFTYREKSDPKSALNIAGLELRKEYEKAIGAPVYYFVHYSNVNDFFEPLQVNEYGIPEVCPICNSKWTADKNFLYCNKCRLITHSAKWKVENNLL